MSIHLVFDLGGVVLRWRPREVVRAALPARVASDADAAHWAAQVFQGGTGDWGEFDRGTVDVPALAARISARTGLAPAEVRAVVDAAAAELQPLPETVDWLRALHAAGHRLFFLSNMPAPLAAAFGPRHGGPGGFWHCFTDGVYSSAVGLIKPEPAIYAVAERRFGLPGAALCFLDDHRPNVDAARAAGWQALHFTGAAAAAQALRAVHEFGDR